MPTIYLSYTNKINPQGASPVLTIDQIWQGLQRKIRHAEEFVPVISACKVLEEKDGVVTREVNFVEGKGPARVAKETVHSYYPSWVDFIQEDGAHIRNVVSNGPSGEKDDLHMTYMFEINLPEGADVEAEQAKFKGMSRMAVDMSIKTIREMVTDGRIE